MKITAFLLAGLITLHLQAQPSKHFHPYIRDYTHSNASIVFEDGITGKKATFTGSQLLSVDIDTSHFICLKGDFFQIIDTQSNGYLLKKTSDASSKPIYNGTRPIFANGTKGRLNDYFLYDPAIHTLQVVNSKTMAHVTPTASLKQY